MTDTAFTPSELLAGLPARQGFGDATLIRLAAGSIDLGGGNPATDLLPLDLYREAFVEVTRSEGFAPLLAELIARDLRGDADPRLAPFRP